MKDMENTTQMEKPGMPELLEKTLQQAVDRFTSSVSLSLFKKHYPSLYNEDRAMMRAIHYQFVKDLNSNITKEVKTDIAEQNVLKLLKTLDGLVAATTKETELEQEEVWRPSGNPTEDLKPHRITVKLKAKEELQDMLRKLQQEDEVLRAAIAQTHETLAELEKPLENKLQLFSKTASACNQLPMTAIDEYLTKSDAVLVFNHDASACNQPPMTAIDEYLTKSDAVLVFNHDAAR